MFRITEDPSSGSLVQYLAKITIQNGSIVSVELDVVGVMATYCNPICVCVCVSVCVCVCVCSPLSRKVLSYGTLGRSRGM